MKKIFNRLTIMLSLVLFLACTDDSLDPFRFAELEKGILLALRGDAFDNLNDNGCSNTFYFNDVQTDDAFAFDAEFLSADQDLLQEVRVFALTVPTTPGKAVKARTPLITVPGSAFTIPSGGAHKIGTISVTFAEIKAALGLTDTEIQNLSKTELTIESDIILTDGRTIASSQIVNSGLFESAIFYPAHKLSYCAVDVDDAKPAASLSLRGAVVKNADGETTARPVLPLKDGSLDTLYIKFNQKIITKPTVTLSPNVGTLGNGGVVQTSKKIDKDGNYTADDDPTAFFITYTAPAGYTGAVKATVSGANSTDTGVDLIQNPKSTNINVDNEKPIPTTSVSTGGVIGRNQFNTISLSFNEAIVKAPEIKVYGQGLDGIGTDDLGAPDPTVKVKMTIDPKNAKKVSYIFIYKDSDNPTDALHGSLTIDIFGGEDGAGNVIDAILVTSLLNDVGTPPVPTVALSGPPHDFGTQIRWTIGTSTDPSAFALPTNATTPSAPGNSGGSVEGTVFYWAVPTGTQAPLQKIKLTAGIPVNDGFMYKAWDDATAYVIGDVVSSGGSYWVALAASTDSEPSASNVDWDEITVTPGETEIGTNVFSNFSANGTFDFYFYFVNSTGNVSPITTTSPIPGVVMN